jgi:hypothetical protein
VHLWIRNRTPKPPARYRNATLTWTADRVGTARADDGATLNVILPNGLWCRAGDRVALFLYPDGWVAVHRICVGPALEYR